jgi:large subunit ribosomal protein L24
MNKFKKDDTVLVTTGKDSGKSGKILKVIPKKNTVIVEGINKKSKHKKKQQDKAGGIVEMEFPIDVSNVIHFESKTKKGSKVEFILSKNKKVRKLKINKVVID